VEHPTDIPTGSASHDPIEGRGEVQDLATFVVPPTSRFPSGLKAMQLGVLAFASNVRANLPLFTSGCNGAFHASDGNLCSSDK